MAGTGVQGYSGDNGPATSAQINYGKGVGFDNSGRLLFEDTDNHRVRMIANGIITTIAGTGVGGFSGDDGPATSAQLNRPFGLAVDSTGNILIADTINMRLRMISYTTGTITTVAGTGVSGYNGDNINAVTAQLSNPQAVAFDASGRLLIADAGNNRIRMIANGIITTIAGTGVSGFSGDNGVATSAQLNYPIALAIDAIGNIAVGDGNFRLRMISYTTGTITTVAGTGVQGYSGDNGPATSAQLSTIIGVAFERSGSIVITDIGNSVVRMVSKPSGIITTLVSVPSPGCLAIDGSGNIHVASDSFKLIRINAPAPTPLPTG
jgi:hypothetical protein